MLNRSDGIVIRNHGGMSTASVLPPDDLPEQWKVTAHKSVSDWYLSVSPGYVQYMVYTTTIAGGGNRQILMGDGRINPTSYTATGSMINSKIDTVGCHYGLRYGIANQLSLGQQYKCESEDDMFVFLYNAHPGGGPPKLGIVSVGVFNSHFTYGGFSGTTPYNGTVGLVKHATKISTTADAFGKITSVTLDNVSIWKRLGLNVLPIAFFERSTGKVTQYHCCQADMVYSAESFIGTSESDPETGTSDLDGTSPPDDAGWSTYFLQTGAPNAPAGYTFATAYEE